MHRVATFSTATTAELGDLRDGQALMDLQEEVRGRIGASHGLLGERNSRTTALVVGSVEDLGTARSGHVVHGGPCRCRRSRRGVLYHTVRAAEGFQPVCSQSETVIKHRLSRRGRGGTHRRVGSGVVRVTVVTISKVRHHHHGTVHTISHCGELHVLAGADRTPQRRRSGGGKTDLARIDGQSLGEEQHWCSAQGLVQDGHSCGVGNATRRGNRKRSGLHQIKHGLAGSGVISAL
mmetsp:Transcript_32820/g.56088  ORF Transcript_32820/g.56088 Transcript_32820/m.56088 type:complete len:235 (+) Transcript_32820:183-887(+)